MKAQTIRLWAARSAILALALYFSIAAYADHHSPLRMLGGIAIAYVFAWLGGEIERNRETSNAS